MREQELLYNLFERHLYIFTTHHEDIPTFVTTVVEEYLVSLRGFCFASSFCDKVS